MTAGRIILLAVALISGWADFRSEAASLATEPFTDSTGGWQDRGATQMTVTNVLAGGNPGGCLQGTFPFEVIPGIPPNDAFVATGRLASANFIGNYAEADAGLLGFDFRANQVVPALDDLRVRLLAGTNKLERFLNGVVTATGVWYSIRLSLLNPQVEGWTGNTAEFANILTNVARVEIDITRNGTAQQTYLVDNVFLDRLPQATLLAPTTNGMDVTWLHLRSGVTYRMDATASLNPPTWTNVASVTATTSVFQASHSTTQDVQIYRMVLE